MQQYVTLWQASFSKKKKKKDVIGRNLDTIYVKEIGEGTENLKKELSVSQTKPRHKRAIREAEGSSR